MNLSLRKLAVWVLSGLVIWAFVAVVVVYVAIVAAGPSLRTPGGLAFQVTVQKIMVYASVLNFSYQAHGVRNALAPTRTVLQVAHR